MQTASQQTTDMLYDMGFTPQHPEYGEAVQPMWLESTMTLLVPAFDGGKWADPWTSTIYFGWVVEELDDGMIVSEDGKGCRMSWEPASDYPPHRLNRVPYVRVS